MPWVVASKPFVPATRFPSVGPPNEITRQWLVENPWVTTSNDVWQAAVTCLDDLFDEIPGLDQVLYLNKVVTRMRVKFPDLVPDFGFLGIPGLRWIGAIPEGDAHVKELAGQRPLLCRMPNDGRPPGYFADLVWFLPPKKMAAIPPHLLCPMVAALDDGGSVCLAASTQEVLEHTAQQIRLMAGGPTKAMN
jgi:hypothetical protein